MWRHCWVQQRLTSDPTQPNPTQPSTTLKQSTREGGETLVLVLGYSLKLINWFVPRKSEKQKRLIDLEELTWYQFIKNVLTVLVLVILTPHRESVVFASLNMCDSGTPNLSIYLYIHQNMAQYKASFCCYGRVGFLCQSHKQIQSNATNVTNHTIRK